MSTLIVYENDKKRDCTFTPGENLLDALRRSGCAVAAPCGGHGVCGKCRVNFNGEEVLACQTTLRDGGTVYLKAEKGDLSWNDASGTLSAERRRTGYGAAIDLGTTTVAMTLHRLSDGKLLGSISDWNAQKGWGGDVISRIGYCMDHEEGLSVLMGSIRSQILSLLDALCARCGIERGEVTEMVLAGNTVMQHIFAGLSPRSIASAPFTPLSLFREGLPCMLSGIPVYLAPCVAGYVGGDITAGVLHTALRDRPGHCLFLDVGTNGEMVLASGGTLTACAVASGPAFEGAGISCGMSASYGAVHQVTLTEDGLAYEVLGGGEATGLCGSGLLDLAACLIELGYIDESGCLLTDEAAFYLTDRVYLTQQDVRQLQLAKAAVAAGIRLLLQEQQLTARDIDAVYLAGGFGNRLRPESAVRIGMLPSQLSRCTIAVGNASLSGAQQVLLSPSRRQTLTAIAEECRYIELSTHRDFNPCFIEEMRFEKIHFPEDFV